MDRLESSGILRKSYSNEPVKTLSFLQDDTEDHLTTDVVTTQADDKQKSKTEKSVHFADEESVAEDDSSFNDSPPSQTSRDVISWLPSEHLYSEDTFIDETETGKTTTRATSRDADQVTSIPTTYSYGSSTFEELESEDDITNTTTEQLYSYTDSFVSSEVFSNPSGMSLYKEWRDVTEIVKDIEELEESEFVTRADSLDSDVVEGEETEASETFEEEIAEAARQDFIQLAIRRLRLKDLRSKDGLAAGSTVYSQGLGRPLPSGPRSREEKTFCGKMIKVCNKKRENKKVPTTEVTFPHPLYEEVAKGSSSQLPIAWYGLNPALVERLRVSNLQHTLARKSQQLDADIMESENFVANNEADEGHARRHFLSQMCSHVQRVNMEDAIQAHLIKTHPVSQFAQLVSRLPKPDEDAREILYKYKRQLESRLDHDRTEIT